MVVKKWGCLDNGGKEIDPVLLFLYAHDTALTASFWLWLILTSQLSILSAFLLYINRMFETSFLCMPGRYGYVVVFFCWLLNFHCAPCFMHIVHSLTSIPLLIYLPRFTSFFFNSIFAGSCGVFTLLVLCQACQLYFSILATSVHKARNDRWVSSSTTIKVWAKEKYSRCAEMLCSSRFILCYKDFCKVIQDYVF